MDVARIYDPAGCTPCSIYSTIRDVQRNTRLKQNCVLHIVGKVMLHRMSRSAVVGLPETGESE